VSGGVFVREGVLLLITKSRRQSTSMLVASGVRQTSGNVATKLYADTNRHLTLGPKSSGPPQTDGTTPGETHWDDSGIFVWAVSNWRLIKFDKPVTKMLFRGNGDIEMVSVAGNGKELGVISQLQTVGSAHVNSDNVVLSSQGALALSNPLLLLNTTMYMAVTFAWALPDTSEWSRGEIPLNQCVTHQNGLTFQQKVGRAATRYDDATLGALYRFKSSHPDHTKQQVNENTGRWERRDLHQREILVTIGYDSTDTHTQRILLVNGVHQSQISPLLLGGTGGQDWPGLLTQLGSSTIASGGEGTMTIRLFCLYQGLHSDQEVHEVNASIAAELGIVL
jgi:hypothetical protein